MARSYDKAVNELFLQFKKENSDYKIVKEIEDYKRKHNINQYYDVIDGYSHELGLSFGVQNREVSSKEMYKGYYHYSNNCIVKESRGEKIYDSNCDLISNLDECVVRTIKNVLSELKCYVEYQKEDNIEYFK